MNSIAIQFVVAFALLGGMVQVAPAQVVPAQAKKPERTNFILVLVDDMGWSDLSCFGNEQVTTDNIDRLAKEGIRFKSFYVNAPICSPSRTAITTGHYPQRWRIHSYLNNRKDNARRGLANWLEPSAPSLARILQSAGYATGHFGKWHMGGQRDVGEAPLIVDYGFDSSLTNFEGLGPRLLPLCDAYDGSPAKPHALGSDLLGNGSIAWKQRDEITGGFVDAAIEFMDAAQQSGKPFYINLWPDDVHSPHFPPKSLRGDSSKKQLYHGVLKHMDHQLGKLFDYVRASDELRENTLILFCSDNGPEAGSGSAHPLRGHKTNLYEGGIRSPLIVWGPAFIAESTRGSVNEESYFCGLDLLPSIASIAGVSLDRAYNFDGENVAATMLGMRRNSRSGPIFWRRPPDRPGNKKEDFPDLAMRSGKWKLLCEYDGNEPQLYDLVSDPIESNNLAMAEPAQVKRMTEQLLEWNKAVPSDRGVELETEREEN